ncbi:MAG: hypothetical protein GX752_04405 [Clostridium sp.]|nr:hypothetical protein [Clostridium sp.]
MVKITKRLEISILAGTILGVFCVIGASIRFGSELAPYLVFSLWFNRLLLGVVVGAPWGEVSLPKSLIRGAVLGIIVSFAYYSSTGFSDIVSFLAGIIYGIITEGVVFLATSRPKKSM